MPATLAAARQLVVFSLRGEEYGLPIARVQEIIDYTRPRTVLARDPWIAGVIPLRGKVLPVYDLALRLGLGAGVAHVPEPKIVIVEAGGDLAGVVVDDVEQVLTLDAADLEAMPASGDGMDSVIRLGDRLIVLLDVDALFGSAEAA